MIEDCRLKMEDRTIEDRSKKLEAGGWK